MTDINNIVAIVIAIVVVFLVQLACDIMDGGDDE